MPTSVCLFVYSETGSHYGALAGLSSTFILPYVSWWLTCSTRTSSEMKNQATNSEDPLMVLRDKVLNLHFQNGEKKACTTLKTEHLKSGLSANGIFLRDFQQAHSVVQLIYFKCIFKFLG